MTYEAGGLEFWGVEAKPTFHLAPPQFSTSVSNLNLLQNSTGLVYLTSEIPYYSQRLRWTLVSKPDWLDVSPTQGAGSAYLEVRDNGAAQPGNVGYIELQTDPAYGAPTVSSGPLRVKVQVVPGITQEGVLLAGGLDASGQPLNSAEVWNPSTKTTVSTYPMLTPRDRHTATLAPGRNDPPRRRTAFGDQRPGESRVLRSQLRPFLSSLPAQQSAVRPHRHSVSRWTAGRQGTGGGRLLRQRGKGSHERGAL